MPISDGFEACKNILQIYKEKSSMFLNYKHSENNLSSSVSVLPNSSQKLNQCG